jgi:hypothetical protein
MSHPFILSADDRAAIAARDLAARIEAAAAAEYEYATRGGETVGGYVDGGLMMLTVDELPVRRRRLRSKLGPRGLFGPSFDLTQWDLRAADVSEVILQREVTPAGESTFTGFTRVGTHGVRFYLSSFAVSSWFHVAEQYRLAPNRW